MKQNYTLFTRKVGNNTVYYYYVYDENGKRHKFSTGQTTKAAAMNYCSTMLKQGKLLPLELPKQTEKGMVYLLQFIPGAEDIGTNKLYLYIRDKSGKDSNVLSKNIIVN